MRSQSNWEKGLGTNSLSMNFALFPMALMTIRSTRLQPHFDYSYGASLGARWQHEND